MIINLLDQNSFHTLYNSKMYILYKHTRVCYGCDVVIYDVADR